MYISELFSFIRSAPGLIGEIFAGVSDIVND